MQFEAQARIATKMYGLYIAGANGACNEEIHQLCKSYDIIQLLCYLIMHWVSVQLTVERHEKERFF